MENELCKSGRCSGSVAVWLREAAEGTVVCSDRSIHCAFRRCSNPSDLAGKGESQNLNVFGAGWPLEPRQSPNLYLTFSCDQLKTRVWKLGYLSSNLLHKRWIVSRGRPLPGTGRATCRPNEVTRICFLEFGIACLRESKTLPGASTPAHIDRHRRN